MDIESAVIGLCMRDSENLHRALGMGITPDSFVGLGDVFRAIIESDAAGEGVGIQSIYPRMPKEMATKALEIFDQAPVTQRVEYWVQALLDAEWRRKARKALGDVLTQLTHADVFAGNDAIREAITALLDKTHHNPHYFSPLEDALQDACERLDKMAEGIKTEIKSGLEPIDDLMGGFRPGEMYVIAARPGVGKTTISLQFAHDIARQGIPVVFVSLEMTRMELANKLLSTTSRVSNAKIRNGDLQADDYDRLHAAMGEQLKWPFIIGEKMRDVSRLEAGLKGLKKQGKVGFLVIDYIQLMKAPGTWKGNRVAELTEITGRIKGLAQELNIPIIILSQINRQGATTGSSLPGVHHLKDSGSLEQDADAVLILHKAKLEESGEQKYFLMIAKNRHGHTGDFELRAELEYNRFSFPGGETR